MNWSWSPTYVTVKTTALEVLPSSIERYKVDLRIDTWNDVLKNNGVNLDTNKYCLKSCDLKNMVGVDAKVASFVHTYKKKMNVYKVKLCKLTRGDRDRIYHTGTAGATQPTGIFPDLGSFPLANETYGVAHRFIHLGPFQDAVNRNNRNLSPVGIEQNQEHFESEQQRQCHYAEDLFEIPVDENEAPGRSAEDLNDSDTESQLSQDSQMDLDSEDIKETALARLILTPNSVCQKVREEIQNLKQRTKYMKISGYAPATFNLVDYVFQVGK